MTAADDHGLPISVSCDAAANAYRDGVRLLLPAWPGADRDLDRAIEADSDFALAHAVRARLRAIHGKTDAARAARLPMVPQR